MVMVEAILFDKDGTLLDFNGTWLPRYRSAADYVAGLSAGRFSAEDILRLGGYIPENCRWQPDSLLAAGSNDQILASWESLLGRSTGRRTSSTTSQHVFSPGRNRLQARRRAHTTLPRGAGDARGYRLGIATMDDESQARATAEGSRYRRPVRLYLRRRQRLWASSRSPVWWRHLRNTSVCLPVANCDGGGQPPGYPHGSESQREDSVSVSSPAPTTSRSSPATPRTSLETSPSCRRFLKARQAMGEPMPRWVVENRQTDKVK